MNEPNTNKTSKAPEFARGGVLKHDVTLSVTGKAGEDHTETAIQGTSKDILLALAAATGGVLRSLTESGLHPFAAAMIVTDAVKNGIASGIKHVAEHTDQSARKEIARP